MVKEFVNPNWHVILIHYPLGLLIVGFLIELFSFLWRRGGFRAAGRWMILLGALSCIPTALSGLYALADVVRINNPAGEYATWEEIRGQSPLRGEALDMLETHAWLQAGATVIVVFAVVVWLGCSDRWRGRLRLLLMLTLAAGVGLIMAGAWFSGEAVYRHGAGVEIVQTGRTPDEATGRADSTAAQEQQTSKLRIEHCVPPLQAHVTLAGFAIAIALASLGLSIRAISSAPRVDVEQITGERPETPLAGQSPRDGYADAMLRSLNPDAEVSVEPHRIPSARFWLLTALAAAATAAAGLWALASTSETWKLETLWGLVNDPDTRRRLAHVITGSSIVVVPLILAALARWAPQGKLLLWLFALLLILAVATQIWFGSLLLFDTPSGPVTGFNRAEAATQPSQ